MALIDATDGWHISNVDFKYFRSDRVDKETLRKLLIGRKCTVPGKIKIKLSKNRKLQQEGPYMIQPIRFGNTFYSKDEFLIHCDVTAVENTSPDKPSPLGAPSITA